MKLSVKAFGLAFGLAWALAILFVGILSHFGNYGTEFIKVMGSVYLGFDSSWKGILLGIVRGFFDGLIGGVLMALFYNLFIGEKKKK